MTGVVNGAWPLLAASLRDALAAQGEVLEITSAADAIARAGRSADTRVIAWLEPPERIAAQQLTTQDDPASALPQWAEGSAALVRAARQHPGRWLLLNADEALLAPDALGDVLAAWAPEFRSLATPVWPGIDPDPLGRWIGQALVAEQPRWTRLHAELAAACAVLVPDFDAPRSPMAVEPLADRYRQLTGELAALREELRRSREAIRSHEATQANQRGQLDELEARHARARAEATALQLQLHASQEQVEALHIAVDTHKELEQRLAHRERELAQWRQRAGELEASAASTHKDLEQRLMIRERELAQWRQRSADLEAQKTTADTLHTGAQQQLHQLQRELSVKTAGEAELARQRAADQAAHRAALATVEARAARMQAERDDARREASALMGQLHQVQEQLEHHVLHAESLEGELRLMKASGGELLKVGDVRVLHVEDLQAHRHLDVELIDLELPDRVIAHLPLRLVDHGGRPGLLFWDAAEGHRGLSAWQSNGAEGGRAFMLLVPEDPSGRAGLERLGSLDWQIVSGLARLLQVLLSADPTMIRWVPTVARLCRQLEQLPPRLRYDDVTVTSDPALPGALRLRLSSAQFGSRSLGDIEVRWSPQGALLQWLAPDRPDRYAFINWPLDDQGQPLPQFDLPVGGAVNHRAGWQSLHPIDRVLLLGLLDALAGAPGRLAAEGSTVGADPQQLARQGAEFRKQARSALTSLRARAIARRLARRDRADN